MKILQMPIEQVIPYAKNPRKISTQAIDEVANSIKKFGFQSPIVCDKKKVVIAGHTRLAAAKQLGLKSVPVVIATLSKTKANAFRVVDNSTAELSEWDIELLELELKDIYGSDENLLNAFSLPINFYGDEEDGDEEPEPDTPPVPVKPVTKSGDVWILGKHRLMCGDSTDAEQVKIILLSGACVDMIFTDPPYGMALKTDRRKFSNPNQKVLKRFEKVKAKAKVTIHAPIKGDGDDFTPELITTIFDNFPKVKEVFLFGADYYSQLIPDREKGSWVVWDKVTEKSGAESGVAKFHGSNFELVWSKAKHKRELARVLHKGAITHESGITRYHPTQKPVALAAWFLNKWGNEGDIVLDLYGGSGFTLLACEQTNRVCRVMEISPGYCDVIKMRWELLTNQKAVLEKRPGVKRPRRGGRAKR